MSTLPIHFKLAKPGHSTRKVSFEENPSWMLLAHKAEELFRVPMEHLGLVYSDDEGDKITLSSQDELTEFYATARPPFKFVVKDLSSSQDPSVVDDDFLSRAYSAIPGDRPKPPPSPFNLGGIPLTFEVIDDSFPIELLHAAANAGKAGSTAYVEEVGTASRRSTPKVPDDKDKGKGRMQPSVADFEDLGDAAELASHASMDGSFHADGDKNKPPVHVFDAKHDVTVTIEEQKEDPTSFLQRVLDLGRRAREEGGAPDPPLAPIEDKPKAPPPPSLVKDLADVMQQLALTTATQPELTESIRSMLRNVAEGAYWANDTSRQLPNETDEARAGMRLADSLGDLFKALGAGVAREVATALENGTPGPARPRSPPRERRGWDRVRDRMFPNGIPRPPYPPYGPPPPPRFGGRPYPYPPPGPPPPPPPPGVPRYPIAPPPPGERFDIWNPRNFPMLRRAQTYPAAPPPPPPPAPVPPVHSQPTIQFAPPPQIPPRPPLEVARPVHAVQPIQPVAPVPSAPATLDDRRAALEATKQAYIEAKEAYRREKEQRRLERERLARERTGFAALPTGNTSGAPTSEATPAPPLPQVPEETHPFTPRHRTSPLVKAADIPEVPPPPMHPIDVVTAEHDPGAPYTLERAPADVKPERTFAKMAYSPAQFRAAFASPLPPPSKPIGPAGNPFARSPNAFPRSPNVAGNSFPHSPNAAGTPTGRIIARLADMGFNEANHPDLQGRVARHLRANVRPTTEAEDAIVVRLLEELIANTAGSSRPQVMPGAFA
ncbi:hypothetical protein AURDEDRAFT_111667, partial [Auricularia subglabra TFB-10046 SS5]